MSNEIPSARRLVPSGQLDANQHNAAQADQGIPFAAKVAVIAVPIVVGGIALALTVRSQVANSTEAALNDTRSPLAEEIAQPQVIIEPLATAPKPLTERADSANADLSEAEIDPEIDPEIDAEKAPLAVAVNPAIAGIAGSGEFSNTLELPPIGATQKALYGHLPYAEADPSRLSSAGAFIRDNYERAERLDTEAVQAFEQMRQAALAEGINLMPVSGFRSFADQKELFESQTNRKGSAEAAAEFSAPPGHSEHHTGYAIDITDGDYPESDIKRSFENTPAYKWLFANARAYGFEESFPKNNAQGVSFEPWHWRYIASDRARQTFSDAQRLYPSH